MTSVAAAALAGSRSRPAAGAGQRGRKGRRPGAPYRAVSVQSLSHPAAAAGQDPESSGIVASAVAGTSGANTDCLWASGDRQHGHA